MSVVLIKEEVCARCHSNEIVDMNCICTYQRQYEVIELEFEVCTCCNRSDTYPADSEFNRKQLSRDEEE